MVHPLDEVVRAVVDPVMRESGFVRRGRQFWLVAESGTTALAEFYREGELSDGVTRFTVVSGVMPGAEFAKRDREEPVPARLVRSYFTPTRLFAPPLPAFDGVGSPEEDPVWALWPDRRPTVDAALAEVVHRDAPRLADLVRSPQALVDQILAPETSDIWTLPRPLLADAVYVLVTEGRFDEALALAEARGLRGPGFGKFDTGVLEELIEHWKSLGCRRAPGDWEKYVRAPG